MRDAPRRHKSLDELTPAEHAQRQAADRRGEPWSPPETEEYRQRRDEVLRRAGLDDTPKEDA